MTNNEAKPSNTWFGSDCWEAQQNFHIILDYGHLNDTLKTILKKYCRMIQYKKCYDLERKQRELHLLLKSDPKLCCKSFEEKDDLTLPFTPQIVVDYCTLWQSVIDHFVSNIQLLDVFLVGVWLHMKGLPNHNDDDIYMGSNQFSKMGYKWFV